MSDLPTVKTAHDMKALTVLFACDIMQKLDQLGDHAGAHAIKCLVETIEPIPCEGHPHD